MGSPSTAEKEDALRQWEKARIAEVQRLGQFLATGALYSPYTISEAGKKIGNFPETIQLRCNNISCNKEQTFERIDGTSGVQDLGWGKTATYRCRNCRDRHQRYMYVWQDDGRIWKVGQVPELEEAISRKLEKALGQSAPLYKKAVRSRGFGFGIGALSYLRRIIEDTTDVLMDLLREDKWERWTQEERDEFETARTTFQYSQKMSYAADRILPADVFVAGKNPFTALHDVTSNGLHGLTEEVCIKLFDRCNLIFTHSFEVLYQHRKERQEFAAGLNALQRDS